ncbi:tetratricopeptide repeat protein [Streptomyces sp. NPDC046237]|uniref:tetratricopeptide repeat protein n=1 Tax=Streptomyces sp. NPDC046237 TaxID=3154914 RepID=UPI00340C968E
MSDSQNDEGPVHGSGSAGSGSGSDAGPDSSDGHVRAGERDGLLAAAVALREQGRQEEARDRLVALAARHPDDAEVAYQTAWAHDVLGLEAEAVPYYERALKATTGEGLSEEDRRGALLGLGSTFRVLGRYEEAVATLRGGIEEFPDDGALRAFLAMALYNTGEHHESTRLLLRLVAATSEDPGVRTYRRAIEHYAADLDETV